MIKSYIKENKIVVLFLLLFLFVFPFSLSADDNLAERLSGKILLQVELHGEAWYINPANLKRYYMGRPDDAFSLMRNLGVGITNSNLEKIPIGFIDDVDSDNDGLSDDLEGALGTDPLDTDTDNDGHSDQEEIYNNFNPLGSGILNIDFDFSLLHGGKIFLQVEKNGEAWYINPTDSKRYYLGRPDDAFRIMRAFGLGIKTAELEKINEYKKTEPLIINDDPDDDPDDDTPVGAEDVINKAADAIRAFDTEKTASFFIPEMKKTIEINFENMSEESLFILGNILSGSTIKSRTDDELIYYNDVYFALADEDISLEFHVKKQEDGSWLLANL